MFSNSERIINCYTCGDLTEQIIKNGKIIKNCVKCRELNNNKKKKTAPPIKYETQPKNGFYNNDKIIRTNNNIIETSTTPSEQEETTEEQEETTEEEEEQPTQEDQPTQEEQAEQEEQPKENTIKEILHDILNKLNNTTLKDNNNNKTRDEIEPILNNILEQLDHEKTNEFIKEQQLKNKIIINKLDNILKAIA